MQRIMLTVVLLVGSNAFMTLAWYGHLKKASWGLLTAIFVSWFIALPEYLLQVPANRLGHVSWGGSMSAPQLKIMQEAITLCVFLVFAIFVLKERPRVQDYVAFGLVLAAVVVAMWGRDAPPAASPGEVAAEVR